MQRAMQRGRYHKRAFMNLVSGVLWMCHPDTLHCIQYVHLYTSVQLLTWLNQVLDYSYKWPFEMCITELNTRDDALSWIQMRPLLLMHGEK